MAMHDGLPGEATRATLPALRLQGRVPSLDIGGLELLDQLGAEIGYNLALGHLAIALGRLGSNVAIGLPLLHTSPDMLGHGELGWLDITAVVLGFEKLDQLALRILPGALNAGIADDALARGRVATVIELQLPGALAAAANVAGHFCPLIILIFS